MMASATFCDLPRAQSLAAPLQPDLAEAARCLGASAQDEAALSLLRQAAVRIIPAAQPRMVWARLDRDSFAALGLLQGQDIARHLQGCRSVVLLGVTVGSGVDAAVRRAGVGNVALLAAADAVASALAEAAAEAAEAELRRCFSAQGRYLTGRYSPGYGDWPLSVQQRFGALLDLPKRLGVSVGADDLLLPRKSVTAALGVSQTPVSGRRAGCGHCVLRETCEYRKRGQTCADE